MDFDFSENERILGEKIKGLFDPDTRSALAKLENGDENQIRNTLLRWLKTLGQTGYLTPGLDDGRNYIGLVTAQEGLAMTSPSLFLSVEVSVRIFGRLIAMYGTPDQKKEILPDLREGLLIGTVALSEEGMNIENNPLNTSGVQIDNDLQVSGSKSHVVNGPIADWIAVAGKMDEKLAFFLIKKTSEGLSIGKRLPSLGYSGTAISTVSLYNCPVSSRYIIGPFEGREPLKMARTWEDQILTASSLGLMQRCYDTALAYAKNHKSGGKPIIAYQEVGFKLAEMLTLLQTAHLLAYRAAWMTESGDREASVLAHCAKVFCTEATEAIASNALQILGGYGFLGDNPAEEGYRNAKYLQIAGTSSEISRVKIGDGLLEME